MRQVLQNIGNGETEVADVPTPGVQPGYLLSDTHKTLISAGTERMLVDFGKSGWLSKAKQQPDKVRMVLDKLRTDGLLNTLDSVTSKLDQPIALGYCNVGTVSAVGEDVSGVAIGDRVLSNGPHAEVVCVPRNLCARIPDNVPDNHAVFGVLGAIGLQGIRLARLTIGECVVVIGLGLIGLLTVQILRAHGCRVLGLDFNRQRLALAELFGAETVNLDAGEDPIAAAQRFSRGRGVDAVLIASSGDSNEPVGQAATMCRKRGRIVLIGVAGLKLSRADFYEKELSFQVSCSYGPGRYDSDYEEKGIDYPVGFVRWTEQRNFEAVLDLMSAGQLNVEPLISHRFRIDNAEKAYDTLMSDAEALGIVLEYEVGGEKSTSSTIQLANDAGAERTGTKERPAVGVIGAGNYAGRVLIPAFGRADCTLKTLVTRGGVGATHIGKKYGFQTVSTDKGSIFDDPSIDLVVVATRHDSHANYAAMALESGKSVFVEKPLCLTLDELDMLSSAAASGAGLLVVGFNRRFSPLTVKAKELLSATSGPKSMVMTVNAGAIPADHWTRDVTIGGGRILGEACHFVDLMRHLVGAPIEGFTASAIPSRAASEPASESASISLSFADGSIGAIQYFTNGHRQFPKERLEVFVDGKALQIDNFRRLSGWGWKDFRKQTLLRQDKGQAACVQATIEAVRSGSDAPIAIDEVLEVSRVSIELAASVR